MRGLRASLSGVSPGVAATLRRRTPYSFSGQILSARHDPVLFPRPRYPLYGFHELFSISVLIEEMLAARGMKEEGGGVKTVAVICEFIVLA